MHVLEMFLAILPAFLLVEVIKRKCFPVISAEEIKALIQEECKLSFDFQRKEILNTIEVYFDKAMEEHCEDKEDLELALKRTFEELNVLLQTYRSLPDTEEIRYQEILEWVFKHAIDRLIEKDNKVEDILNTVMIELKNRPALT